MRKYLGEKLGKFAGWLSLWIDYRFLGSASSMDDAKAINDPFTHYSTIRERGKVLRSVRNGGWMALGYDEVQQVFLDKRLSADMRKNAFVSGLIRAAADGRNVIFLDNPTMLNLDPPDHSRLRKLANHGFVHKSILKLEPRIRELVNECLDTIDSEQFDVVEVLAKPLPVLVIAELLGLPKEDVPWFQEISRKFLGITAIGNNELMDIGTDAGIELGEYFEKIIEQKRQKPGDDLISQLLAVEEEGDKLTKEELNSTCTVLLIAGHETTTHLIGNGMHLLLDHPHQMKKLREQQELIPNAVEEMLRMEPPVLFSARTALENLELGGKTVKKDQLVLAVIGSANRDPNRFTNPDEFNVERQDVGHIAFGYGIHLCIGMSLARLEAKVAFEQLLDRFPELSLPEQNIEFLQLPLNRGRQKLIVSTRD